jgi:hypothetical protein
LSLVELCHFAYPALERMPPLGKHYESERQARSTTRRISNG